MFCFIIYINIHMQLLYKVKLPVYDIGVYSVCCNCVFPASLLNAIGYTELNDRRIYI